MTKTVPTTENHTVTFAQVGGILARRRLSLRRMEALTDIPFVSIRTWLQGGTKRAKNAMKIQSKIEEKLGITIVESPYEEES